MEHSFHEDFVRSTLALQPSETQRVWRAVDDYVNDPDKPGLRVEKLQGRARGRHLWSIRASEELRVLLSREGSTTLFWKAGHHDDIYRIAERVTVVVPRDGAPTLIPLVRSDSSDLDLHDEAGPDGEGVRRVADGSASAADASGAPLSFLAHWTDPELADAGFTPADVRRLRAIPTADSLLEHWPEISNQQLDLVLACCEQSPDQWLQRDLMAADAADSRFRDAILKHGALAGLSSLLTSEELARLVSAPIEEWMIFLHPDQRSLVDRRFRGPARVRGSAGTGKTVVALHRAACLAGRYADDFRRRGAVHPPILFTTFVKSLPPVFAGLYRRLPTAVQGAVDFTNVDKLANRVCRDAGTKPPLDPNTATRLFNEACREVVRSGTPLHRASLTHGYLREEVSAVIKGRGVGSLAEYRDLERTGRRTPFSTPMREQLWELNEEWDRRLRQAKVVDFPDVVRRARQLAERRAEPMYRAAIVDEAQDLTLEGLRFVRALVNGSAGEDKPDGLFIVGDGAQRIYPGGFTLRQAGLDVRGNSAVLRVNYRNTPQILEAAMACAGGEPVDDLGERYSRAEEIGVSVRDGGAKPFLVRGGRFSDQVEYAAARIEDLRGSASLAFRDVGMFVPTNERSREAIGQLKRLGISAQSLADVDGGSRDAVKVGTFHRAKGLEFKVVFLLDLSEGVFPGGRARWQSEQEHAERRAMQITELFVAMTRARDGLFLIYGDEPSAVLYEALDYVDEVA